MKKMITLVLAICMIFGCFTITTNATTSTGSKYTKVKTATYNKYKKAYKQNKSLKTEVKELKAEVKELKANSTTAEVTSLKTKVTHLTNENKILKEENAEMAARLEGLGDNEDIDEIKHRLKQQEEINDWLWMSIKSLGISYSNKTWKVPENFPTTFMVNGTKYTVVITQE